MFFVFLLLALAVLLKGQCQEIFYPRFFTILTHAYGFNLAEIFAYAKRSAVSMSPQSKKIYFRFEYLREIIALFENTEHANRRPPD